MKDYSKILESSGKNSLQRIINIGADQKLNEWNILQLVEEMSGKMRNRLDAVLDAQWKQSVGGVQLQLSESTGKSKRLMLKAQIFRQGPAKLTLKVFAHEILPGGKTVKIAKAVYQITLVRSLKRGNAA